MAIHAGAATYLVGDIDRGGIFASLYGTIALLTPEEKACIKGIIINKFRGDSRLFEEGRKLIEDLCGLPVVGVLPYFRDILIEEEDSVSLKNKQRETVTGKVNIAVILLNRMSNFTDFACLENDPRVNLFYTDQPSRIAASDIILLPGSKNTIEDLNAIKNNGVATAVVEASKKGKTVVGICGGYQMMGELVEDPHGVESNVGMVAGLGLLPVRTVLLPEKTTLQRTFKFRYFEETCKGYEIHMGETIATSPGVQAANTLSDGATDGCYLNEKCWGTYLHGILDNTIVVSELLSPFTKATALDFNYQQYKEEQYDKLAALIRAHVDLEQIYKTLQYQS